MADSPAVLEVVRARAATSSKPGDRDDPWSVALDWNRVLESPIRLHPVATSVDTLEWVDLGADGFETKSDLKEALRGSSQYPFLAGPPVEFRGGRYMDAGLRLSIPAPSAVQAGCTHLLVLRTRPDGAIRPAPAPLLDRALIAPRLARIDRRLSRLHLDRHEIYAAELDGLRELENAGIARSVTPDPAVPTISGFEREPERILAAAREGIRSVYRAIQDREPTTVELLLPSDRAHR